MAYEYTTRDGKRVEVQVAEAFDKLAAAFNRQFGLTLHVRSGTRTTAEQQRLYDLYKSGRGSLAAVPGTSNHEEGGPTGPRALDVYDSGSDWGVTRAGSVRANWLRRNALAVANFDPAGYRFSQVEPWHIEFRGQLSDKVAPAPPPAPPTPVAPAPTNPFGIPDVRGLQKIARQNGGATAIDNKWGPESAKGFTNFLERKYGYRGNDTLGPVMWAAIAKWLRSRWGYVGNDTPGPKMRAALSKANTANFEQLK